MAKKTKKVTKRIDALVKARERYEVENSCGVVGGKKITAPGAKKPRERIAATVS